MTTKVRLQFKPGTSKAERIRVKSLAQQLADQQPPLTESLFPELRKDESDVLAEAILDADRAPTLADLTKEELITVITSAGYGPTVKELVFIIWDRFAKKAVRDMDAAANEQNRVAALDGVEPRLQFIGAATKFDQAMELSRKADAFMKKWRGGL